MTLFGRHCQQLGMLQSARMGGGSYRLVNTLQCRDRVCVFLWLTVSL